MGCEENKRQEVTGLWTCVRAELRGRPTCLQTEAKNWNIAWVMPKIVGGFEIKGKLLRTLNISNATLEVFQKNVSLSLVSCLIGVHQRDFEYFSVLHLWEAQDPYDPLTGELLDEREHLFSVNYELLVWDVNVFRDNWDALTE